MVLYWEIQHVFLVYCCRARCIEFVLYWRAAIGMPTFHDVPAELQGCCAAYLDTTSAGRFGLASKACSLLVEQQLAAAKAARARAAPFEKSKHGAMVTYRNPTDGSKLVTFSAHRAFINNALHVLMLAGEGVPHWALLLRPRAAPGVSPALEALAPRRLWRGGADRGCVACICSLAAERACAARAPHRVSTRTVDCVGLYRYAA